MPSTIDIALGRMAAGPGSPSTAPAGGGLAGTAGSSAQVAGSNALTSQIPGYMTSMKNIGTNIQSETAGEVPADVIEQLKQQGAEQNVTTGSASNAAYLKALGLTSLGLTQTGQNNLEQIEAATPGYTVSQNPEFQTGANLQYEEQLQPEVFARQDQQQQFAVGQQQAALRAAQAGLGTNTSGNVDALGFPNTTTATLGGQTPAGGSGFNPWSGTYTGNASGAFSTNPWTGQPIYGNSQDMVAYGPGGGPTTNMGGPVANWEDTTGAAPQPVTADSTPVDYYGDGGDYSDY